MSVRRSWLFRINSVRGFFSLQGKLQCHMWNRFGGIVREDFDLRLTFVICGHIVSTAVSIFLWLLVPRNLQLLIIIVFYQVLSLFLAWEMKFSKAPILSPQSTIIFHCLVLYCCVPTRIWHLNHLYSFSVRCRFISSTCILFWRVSDIILQFASQFKVIFLYLLSSCPCVLRNFILQEVSFYDSILYI